MNQIAMQPSVRTLMPEAMVAFARNPHKAPALVMEQARLRIIKARLRVAQQLATPGFMALHALRELGEIVDFVWDSASEEVRRLLCRVPFDLAGKRLSDVLEAFPARPVVFSQYRRVVEFGSAEPTMQEHMVNGASDIYRHGAVRVGDGVAVTLVNVSALKRVAALELQSQMESSPSATDRR